MIQTNDPGLAHLVVSMNWAVPMTTIAAPRSTRLTGHQPAAERVTSGDISTEILTLFGSGTARLTIGSYPSGFPCTKEPDSTDQLLASGRHSGRGVAKSSLNHVGGDGLIGSSASSHDSLGAMATIAGEGFVFAAGVGNGVVVPGPTTIKGAATTGWAGSAVAWTGGVGAGRADGVGASSTAMRVVMSCALIDRIEPTRGATICNAARPTISPRRTGRYAARAP